MSAQAGGACAGASTLLRAGRPTARAHRAGAAIGRCTTRQTHRLRRFALEGGAAPRAHARRVRVRARAPRRRPRMRVALRQVDVDELSSQRSSAAARRSGTDCARDLVLVVLRVRTVLLAGHVAAASPSLAVRAHRRSREHHGGQVDVGVGLVGPGETALIVIEADVQQPVVIRDQRGATCRDRAGRDRHAQHLRPRGRRPLPQIVGRSATRPRRTRGRPAHLRQRQPRRVGCRPATSSIEAGVDGERPELVEPIAPTRARAVPAQGPALDLLRDRRWPTCCASRTSSGSCSSAR